MCLNTYFQFLNNITHIFIYFLIHTYFFKKTKIYYLSTQPNYCSLKSTVSNGCDKQAHLVGRVRLLSMIRVVDYV